MCVVMVEYGCVWCAVWLGGVGSVGCFWAVFWCVFLSHSSEAERREEGGGGSTPTDNRHQPPPTDMTTPTVVSDLILPESPADSVTSLSFAAPVGATDLLCSSSWDATVCVWEISPTGETIPRAKSQHSTPVLTAVWCADRSHIAFGGCDGAVKLWDVQANQTIHIGHHDKPVKQIIDLSQVAAASPQAIPSLVSCGWDKKLKYWDPRSPSATGAGVIEVDLPEKAYAMDQRAGILVVATAERHICIFDIRNTKAPVKTIASPLRFQSRCIALFPDAKGFALSVDNQTTIGHDTSQLHIRTSPQTNFYSCCVFFLVCVC